MGSPSKLDDDQSAGPRPFQYSLRSMLILTTAAAIALSLLVASPGWVSMLTVVFLAMAIPMALTVSLVYGRGRLRTFSIGALFPAVAMMIEFVPNLSYSFSSFARGNFDGPDPAERLAAVVLMIVGCAISAGFGVLAMWLRTIVETRVPQQPDGTAWRIKPASEAEEPRSDAEYPSD